MALNAIIPWNCLDAFLLTGDEDITGVKGTYQNPVLWELKPQVPAMVHAPKYTL